jgi:ATP-dependent helicase/nuclease subunit B
VVALTSPVDPRLPPAALWADVAARSRAWAAAQGVALRDAVLLLPFAALLAPARRAFAGAGGWMPRIETAATLAGSLGPPLPHELGQLTFDAAFDALVVAPLLQRQAAFARWPQGDARGFGLAVQQVVTLAHALARAAAAVAPLERDAWWSDARARLAPLAGDPAADERLLARVALECAAHASPPLDDALWALRPSAWIVLRAGGDDAFTDALLASGPAPALRLDADAGMLDAVGPAQLRVGICDGFEHEAQRAATCVLEHLRRGARPVALVAQDRMLVRRVRALLARQSVPMLDETGWRLSTTRAAATVMTLLRAARPDAASDALLDWLKTAPLCAGVDALETLLRRGGVVRVAAVDTLPLEGAAADAWRDARARLAPLREAPRRPLAGWLDALRGALGISLDDDAAGQQVQGALFAPRPAHDATLTLAAFTDWVDATLEQASFAPRDAGEPAVIVTPLARAMLRPFAAVVLPGADAQRLGAGTEAQPLLGDALAVALGLPGIDARRHAERIAFAQLQRMPHVDVLYRRRDGDEPLAPSALLERLLLRRRAAGLDAPGDVSALPQRDVAAQPLARPAPTPRQVPEQLSASAVEALRDCPYRFHARSVLRLRDRDELDDEPEKRHYGLWLHAVLHRFHATREAPAPSADAEVARLLALGGEERERAHLDAAAFLPYWAGFERLAPLYVDWQRRRDADGARFVEGEVKREARFEQLGDVVLNGRIDRIDRVADSTLEVLDYKAKLAADLRPRRGDPFEDTQLAVYALLAGDDARHAAYVALDEADAVKRVPHADVAATADALLHGLGGELQRMRDGAALPALGEGRVCDHCEARGLCRRDDWS